MKKLMVVVAILCATVVSNAATAKWTCNNAYQPGSSTVKAGGYLAYFVESSTYSYNSALDSLEKGDISFLSSKAKSGASGRLSATGVGNVANWGDYANSETVTGYLVILNTTSDASAATLAYLSAERSGQVGGTGAAASITFGNLAGGSGATSPDTRDKENWYAIPEPTSGLLLLLGFAGLALRRRRA